MQLGICLENISERNKRVKMVQLPVEKVGPPVLNLAAFLEDDSDPGVPEKREMILQQISKACKEYGLFQIINHGVDPVLLSKTLESAKAFFELPLEQKLKSKTAGNIFGFVHQSAVVGGPRDKKENFFCAMEDNPASKNNVWPESPASFRSNAVELARQMQKTATFMMTILAQSLGLSKATLMNCYKNEDYFTILHYPAISDYEGPILAKHQDGTIFTLVAQLNQVAGYQVFKDDTWYTVMPEKDALILNIGDLLQAFTNGRYKSALHRVVANKTERFSFVHSHLPESHTQVAPLPQFTVDEPPRYRSFVQGEYLQLRFENKKIDTKLPKEITIEHYAI